MPPACCLKTAKGTFDRVHVEGAGQVARLAASSGARQIVHLSAIGADAASPSAYGRSKAAGEAAVRAVFPQAVILRPPSCSAPRTVFSTVLRRWPRSSRCLPIVGGGDKIPAGLCRRCRRRRGGGDISPQAAGKIFELGGPEVRTFRQLIEYMLNMIERKRMGDRSAAGRRAGAGAVSATPARQIAHHRPDPDAGARQHRLALGAWALPSSASSRRRWT